MFDKVTFNFYKDTLKRTVITSEDVFNSFKLENVAYMETLLPYVTERRTDGIDSAVCLMIEEQYKAQLNKTDNGAKISSFSLDGYSQSMDLSKADSLKENKYKWIRFFCYVDSGVL